MESEEKIVPVKYRSCTRHLVACVRREREGVLFMLCLKMSEKQRNISEGLEDKTDTEKHIPREEEIFNRLKDV